MRWWHKPIGWREKCGFSVCTRCFSPELKRVFDFLFVCFSLCVSVRVCMHACVCMCPQHLKEMANLLEGSQDKKFLHVFSRTNIFVYLLLGLGHIEKRMVIRKENSPLLLCCHSLESQSE